MEAITCFSIAEFESLDDAALVALTPENIEIIHKLYAAESGVKLLGEMPIEPPPAPKPTLAIYKVADLYFRDSADADSVAAFINSKASRCTNEYIWGRGNTYMHHAKNAAYEIEPQTVFVYSDQQVATLKADCDIANERKAQYDKDYKQWESDRNTFNACGTEVRERIAAAQNRIWKKERSQRRYDEYLTLARGDAEMAKAFFLKAYPEDVAFFSPAVATAVPAEVAAAVSVDEL